MTGCCTVGSLKQEILRVLAAEPERFIKSSIAQVVGTVAKHELSEHRWPGLLDFLSQTMMSENLQDKEVSSPLRTANACPIGDSLGLATLRADKTCPFRVSEGPQHHLHHHDAHHPVA